MFTAAGRIEARTPSTLQSSRLRQVTALAALYYVCAVIGLQFAMPPGNSSAVWPSSGIALAVLMRFPALFPGVWFGAFLASLHTDVSLLTAASFASWNTVAAALAGRLCRRMLDLDRLFQTPRHAVLWLSIAALSCLVSATGGIVSLFVGGYIQVDHVWMNWITWWLGDVAGMVIVGPVVAVWSNREILARAERHSVAELLALPAVLLAICHLLFGNWVSADTAEGLLYLPVILLVWLLMSFGLQITLTLNLLLVSLAVAGTSLHMGAFSHGTRSEALLPLQVFLTVYAFTTLILNAMLAKGRESEQRRLMLAAEVRAQDGQMRLAQDIQQRFFPEGPVVGETFKCAGTWRPAHLASADYYDLVPGSNGVVSLVIADVSGHGVGPALIMAETRAYTRALLRSNTGLADQLHQLNAFLFEDTDCSRFVTLALCRYDPATSVAEFAGAGHEGLVIRESGGAERLGASTLPLGIVPNLPAVQSRRVELGTGDLVFLCTDGYFEASSPNGELFGRERIHKALVSGRRQDPERLLRGLTDLVTGFSGGADPADDQTAAVLRVS